MEKAGIRELKQNASAVVAAAASGQTVIITDRGREVARLGPIARSPLEQLRAAGLLREASGTLADLPYPEPGAPISDVLAAMREDERY